MALNPTALANVTNTIHYEELGLQSDNSVTLEQDGVTATHPVLPNNYASRFASAYNDYAKEGEIAGATNEGGDFSMIESALNNIDNTTGAVANLADAFAQYYSNVALIPAEPAHGGNSVSSVTNDAASKASVFESEILSVYTTTQSTPFFLSFIQAIENAAKQITWTVVEDGTSYPENIV
tara:strand:- start:83 stop:622 length:540 start_codon:yes stop_codon:yes gene_type:complete